MGDLEGRAGVLLHQQDSHAALVDLLDGVEDGFDQHRRQAQRRLVQHQNARLGHQRPPDGQHLLLTAGQRAAELTLSLLQAGEEGKDTLAILLDDLHIPFEYVSAHIQILVHRQGAEDFTPFGRVGNTLLYDVVGWHIGDVLPPEVDLALTRPDQARDSAQRGCLSGPVSPDERDDLSFLHLQPEALQGVDVAVVCMQIIDF